MSRLLNFFVIVVIFFWYASTTYSQNDTSLAETQSKTKSSKFEMRKSPTGAIYRSLILPGWGQWYVESYWKAPIFFAAAAGLTGAIIWNQVKFNEQAKLLDGMALNDPDYEITKLRREFYRDNRDMSGFYLIGVYVLAAVDAYVGAHLFDFDVGEDLSFRLTTSPNYPKVIFVIKF